MGTGNKLLLCFHGYGEDAYSFSFLEKHLGETYSLIVIDFPFHGKTVWKDGLLFTANDLLMALAAALKLVE